MWGLCKMLKILLAVPSARYVEVECFESIYNLKKPKGCKIDLFIPNNYSIDVSRNIIVRYAQENGYDYIFWVDDDIILPENALTRLLSHNKDIVAGVYLYKVIGNKKAVAKRYIPNKDDTYEDIEISEIKAHKDLMKVDGFGFGCVLTKTEIFNKIQYPYFIYTLEMGEDIYFCRKAINSGYELYLDTEILCGHKGTVNYNIK